MSMNTNIRIRGNKGEWSEFYAFLKLLTERKLDSSNEKLEVIENSSVPVLCIMRNEKLSKIKEYYLKADSTVEIFSKVDDNTTFITALDSSAFKSSVKIIFECIKENSGSFSIEEAEPLMSLLHCNSLKAGNADKEDIKLILHDYKKHKDVESGFSIKSEIGGSATLLNSSQATNFIFEIKDCNLSDEEINRINFLTGKRKIQDRLSAIYRNGSLIEFKEIKNQIFNGNLRKADSLMPVILSEFVRLYYEGKATTITELTKLVSKSNIIKKEKFSDEDIKFKISQLLMHIALGMVPTKVWSGLQRADGGYIVVKEDGSLVCFHIYNLDNFNLYLYNNTKLETPSSTRHKFGFMYKEDNKVYIDLNLQIRFI